jgi:hypothetical protein
MRDIFIRKGKRKMDKKFEIVELRQRVLTRQIDNLDKHIELCKLQVRRLRSKEKIKQMRDFIEELQFIKKFVIFTGRRYFSKEFLHELFFGQRITNQKEANRFFRDLMEFLKEMRGRI